MYKRQVYQIVSEKSFVFKALRRLISTCRPCRGQREQQVRGVRALSLIHISVKKGDKLAGMRVIPLIIKEETLQAAEQAAGAGPLLEPVSYTHLQSLG